MMLDVDAGVISNVFILRNPDKLRPWLGYPGGSVYSQVVMAATRSPSLP